MPSKFCFNSNAICRTAAFLLAIWVLAGTKTALATQPVRFNYQARLTDSGGAPLQGLHTLFVTIWSPGNVNTPNGGVQRYGETATVTAVNGVVNHVVGSGDHSGFGVPLDDAVLSRDTEIVLQVAVDSESNIVLPRTRLESVPFAVTSRQADLAGNGVPAGGGILATSEIAPAGFSAWGGVLFGNWVARPPLPTGTNRIAAAAVNGMVYAVGGDQGGIRSNNNYRYDPATNTWSTKAPMFTQREHCTLTELGGLLFAVGGITPNGGESALSQNEVYDPANDTWGTSQPLNEQRGGHAAAAANGKLYVFGGFDDSFTHLATVEEFDPQEDTWTPRAPMGAPRSYSAAVTVNEKIHVIGGLASDGTTTTHELYDPLANTWTPKAPLPVANWGMAAVSFDGKVYMIGGSDTPMGDTWIYDTQSDKWTLGPPLAAARFYLGACVANGRIYAVGGTESTATWSARVEELPAGMHYLYTKD